MTVSRRRFMAITTAACLSGSSTLAKPTRFQFVALGAHAEIALPGNPITAEQTVRACRAEIALIERNFSLWLPDSTVSHLNRDGHAAMHDWRFVELLGHAREMAELTDGGFDPTVQSLWTAVAGDEHQSSASNLVDWRALNVSDTEARFTRPGMAATFNGIAQGYAADRVIAILKQAGYNDALANLGEFRGMGVRPDGMPWRIGVENPINSQIAATYKLSDTAIATSEPRGTLINGHPHIFDPLARPGPRWASVTVEAASAWRADALSTAVAAAPTKEALSLLQRGGATAATLISTGDAHHWNPI